MQVSLNPKGLQDWTGTVLVIGVFEGKVEEQADGEDRRGEEEARSREARS